MTANKNNNGSVRRRLVPAVAMLAASAMALASSTYAWFTMSREVEVQNIKMTATVPENIQISLGTITNHAEAVSLAKNTGYLTDSSGATAPTSDYDWSNIADISHYYRFGKLIPASSTDGANIYFTPDAAGVGRTLTATAKFYQAAEGKTAYKYDTSANTWNSTASSGDLASAVSHIVTGDSDTFKADGTEGDTYSKSTAWNVTNDDGYYIDIPVWLRTSSTTQQNVYVCGYVTSQGTSTADTDVDDLYKAVRVSILSATTTNNAETYAADGGCLTLADGLDQYIDPVTNQSVHSQKFPGSQAASNILDSDNYNGTGDASTNLSKSTALGRITNDSKIYGVNATDTTDNATTHVKEASHGEIVQNKGEKVVATLPVGSGSAYGEAKKVIIRVWLEGEDGNCWNENAGQNWDIALKFMTSALPTT